MEFVKDHRADTGQVGVVLQHAGQNALGHDLDTGGFADGAGTADAKAHGLPRFFAQGRSHAFGSCTRGKAARFQHQDAAGGQPRVQHRQRHARGLARTGGRLQHNAALAAQRVDHLRHHVINGKGKSHKRGYGRNPARGQDPACGLDICAAGIETWAKGRERQNL